MENMNVRENKKPFWHKGLRFECISCGHCCRHEPGYVFLSDKDVSRLANFFRLSKKNFAEQHCHQVHLGIACRLSLNETSKNDCIFWNQGCNVYSVRPLQCRTYPFWPGILASEEAWEKESWECPGIGQGKLHSRFEIELALKKKEREVLISALP